MGTLAVAQRAELRTLLFRFGLRLLLWRMVRTTTLGLAAGLGLAALALLAGRLAPVEGMPVLALAFGLAGPVAGAVYGLVTRERPRRIARRLDALFGLHDRVATALEQGDDEAPLSRLQRADALAQLARYQPKDVPAAWPRRPLLACGLLALLVALLAGLPNPQDAVRAERRLVRERAAAAAERVEQVRQMLTTAKLDPAQRRELERALSRLTRELAQAQSRQEAATALANAEQALRRLKSADAAAQAQALTNLAGALAGEPQTAPLADALARRDTAAAQAEARALGEQARAASEDERRELAQALQEAANAVRGDPNLSAALRQAARALAAGDQARAQQGLESLANEIGNAGQVADAVNALNEAAARLEEERRLLAQSTRPGNQRAGGAGEQGEDGLTPPGAESLLGNLGAGGLDQQSGDGQAGEGQQPGAGPAGQSGNSRAGTTEGQAGGQQGRAGGGSANPGGSAGGRSGSSSELGAPQPQGRAGGERVFVPGQPGAGPAQQLPAGQGQASGAARPYQEVLGDYAATAREHVDRAPIPSAMRDLVKRYFVELAEE